MPVLDQVAEKIIAEQARVIGPLAWSEAQKVAGLQVGADHRVALQNGDPRVVIDKLVAQYERLFGRASHEVCKEAAAPLIRGLSASEIPLSLVA
ncbi:MAG TPA: hypothetical protein VN495_03125 [Candidatus Paceibacterota bacterium]|nr:hypothetical protein [Candidatus Paceibacterota bacterium]